MCALFRNTRRLPAKSYFRSFTLCLLLRREKRQPREARSYSTINAARLAGSPLDEIQVRPVREEFPALLFQNLLNKETAEKGYPATMPKVLPFR